MRACKAAKQEVIEVKKQKENLELKVQQLQKEKKCARGTSEKMREVLKIDSNITKNTINETGQTKQQYGQQLDIEDNDNKVTIDMNPSHNLKAANNQSAAAKGNNKTSSSTE